MTYRDEKHNEAVMVETSLQDVDRLLTDLSNTLYRIDPQHLLLDSISNAKHSLDAIDFEAPYAAAKTAAGSAWWVEV